MLYINDLSDRTMMIKGRLFTSDVIWMYLCKPIYCLIYGAFLIMQTVEIVMWIWIPLIIILWYCGFHTFLRIDSGWCFAIGLVIGAMSYCAGIFWFPIIQQHITFNTAIILTMFVNAGIVGGVGLAAMICYKFKPIPESKKYLYVRWIIISSIFTVSYLGELLINVMTESTYEATIWLCLLRLFGMYFWYLSFNLGIFLCGNIAKCNDFDPARFIKSCCYLAWFDLHCISHVFHGFRES